VTVSQSGVERRGIWINWLGGAVAQLRSKGATTFHEGEGPWGSGRGSFVAQCPHEQKGPTAGQVPSSLGERKPSAKGLRTRRKNATTAKNCRPASTAGALRAH
jgi:hypothetical protein